MSIQYIHPDAVRTSIQVIQTCAKIADKAWLQWSLPAALSTDDPKRNLQGGWKTPACRAVEQAQVASLPTSSWVIRRRISQEVVCETFDRQKVEALNWTLYEAVPIKVYLASLNRRTQ